MGKSFPPYVPFQGHNTTPNKLVAHHAALKAPKNQSYRTTEDWGQQFKAVEAYLSDPATVNDETLIGDA